MGHIVLVYNSNIFWFASILHIGRTFLVWCLWTSCSHNIIVPQGEDSVWDWQKIQSLASMEDAQEETHFRQKKSAQKICPRKLVGLRRSGAGSRGAERSGAGSSRVGLSIVIVRSCVARWGGAGRGGVKSATFRACRCDAEEKTDQTQQATSRDK